MKAFRNFIFGLVVAVLTIIPAASWAEGNLGSAGANLNQAGTQAGTTQGSVQTVLGTIINAALTLVGTIFSILMVYAGYLWMTAKGSEDQIEKAKNIVSAAIIGLVVIVSAYAITVFVTNRFETQNANGTGSCCVVCANPGGGSGCTRTWNPIKSNGGCSCSGGTTCNFDDTISQSLCQ